MFCQKFVLINPSKTKGSWVSVSILTPIFSPYPNDNKFESSSPPIISIFSHLSLGDLVKVEGRLQSSKYTDTQGMTRKSFSVITENFERVSSPEKTQHSENQTDPYYARTRD